ncbi:MAG: hypothetical protein HKN52_08825, partial [Eudoraea sp.]|nr:hypothetical protein [Eudoraea sp.]
FEETEIGGWFHKIGVGLLKKEEDDYLFHKKHEIKPAEFKISADSDKILITCISDFCNGYAYILKKEITLQKNSFTSAYYLQNTGEKDINTTEYVHNFMAINNDLIGENYLLKFPFKLTPQLFGATVNPEKKVVIGEKEITFKGPSKEQFFFSNLSGGQHIEAQWELQHQPSNIGIRETGSFRTNKVNLWGWEHVVSPELFHTIYLKPGESTEWLRTYTLFKTP